MLEFCCRCGGAARQPQRTGPSQYVSGQPWACHGLLQDQMKPLQCEAGVVESALGAAAGLDRWFEGAVVLLKRKILQVWRRCLPTTAHRALPVCKWPAQGMPWATARSKCSLCSMLEPVLGAAAGLGRCFEGTAVFAVCWSFAAVEALLANQNLQSPASV